jgi:ADP-ribose pyrophosphatase YjhB (NUDIX family)
MNPIRNSAKAVIIQDGRLLTLKCIVQETIFYQLPGGGQRNGETLVEAVKRECREEISAEVEVGDLIFVRDYIGGKSHGPDWHQVELMFSCTLSDGVECAPGSEPDATQLAIEWLPLARLDEYPLRPNALIAPLMNSTGQYTPVYLGDVD